MSERARNIVAAALLLASLNVLVATCAYLERFPPPVVTTQLLGDPR